MSDVAFVGHTTPPTPWVSGELSRVIAKLRELGQLPALEVALEPGCALTAAEHALLRNIPVRLHPLLPPDQLFDRYQAYPGVVPRLRAVWDHRLTDVATVDAGGISRARRRRRSSLLAAACTTHLVVYDGRDRGSVLDHLQRVMGTHDVVVVDPTAQRTIRIPPTPGASTWNPPSSSPAAAATTS